MAGLAGRPALAEALRPGRNSQGTVRLGGVVSNSELHGSRIAAGLPGGLAEPFANQTRPGWLPRCANVAQRKAGNRRSRRHTPRMSRSEVPQRYHGSEGGAGHRQPESGAPRHGRAEDIGTRNGGVRHPGAERSGGPDGSRSGRLPQPAVEGDDFRSGAMPGRAAVGLTIPVADRIPEGSEGAARPPCGSSETHLSWGTSQGPAP